MPNDPKLWPPGPLKVTRNRALPMAMCVTPSPSPSIETKRSILSFNVSLKRRFTPRRSPSPSSPTVATKVIVPGVDDAGLVQRSRDGKQIGEPAAIVADAGTAKHVAVSSNFDVGAARKHRVEVRAHDDVRPRIRARALGDDVAFGVDADVLQAGFAQHPGVQLRALRFLKRRRLDLADPDLIVDGPHLVGSGELDSRANRRRLKEHRTQIGRALLCGGEVDNPATPRRAAIWIEAVRCM